MRRRSRRPPISGVSSLQRRSALAFDGHSAMAREAFTDVLGSALAAGPPWWPWWRGEPHVHLAVFVHRVKSLPAGLYMLVRNPRSHERLREACARDFLWERADERLPLSAWPAATAGRLHSGSAAIRRLLRTDFSLSA